MKLQEIKIVPPISDSGIPKEKIHWEIGKQIATADNFPVYQYPTTNSAQTLYTLKVDNQNVTFLILQDWKTKWGEQYKLVMRAWTNPEHRGHNYSEALLNTLRAKLNFKYASDWELTPEGKKAWESISKTTKLFALNYMTGEKQPVDELKDKEDLYTPEKTLIFATEGQTEHEKFDVEMKGVNLENTILKEYNLFVKE